MFSIKKILLLFALLITAISNFGNSNGLNKNIAVKLTSLSQATTLYSLKDLIEFSKSKYGFVKKDGTLNEYYGDFDCVSVEKNLFDFSVGCGSAADIISIIILKNNSKINCFDLYIPKGNIYYGKHALSNKRVGQFRIISENEIHGNINLCQRETSGCCGEEGEIFIIKKLPTVSNLSSDKLKEFSVKR